MSSVLEFEKNESLHAPLYLHEKDAENIIRQDRCAIFMGKVSLGSIRKLANSMSGEVSLDADAACAIGARVVLGRPSDIKKLRANGLRKAPIGPSNWQ